jgi:hydrogenase nickel incorporation protein HypB
MCEDCGCGDNELVPVHVHERILADNDARAEHLREHFEEAGVLAINLMGSPGSGKTAVLEAVAKVAGEMRIGAVSGDLATDNDARRLRHAGILAAPITTGNACHLDAKLVHDALHHMPWRELDLFVIENVGNLVCPAIYDLGEDARVVALSITEGEDKPLKYPTMFRNADLVLLTKIDLAPHLDVDIDLILANLACVMPEPSVIMVSAKTGTGIAEWLAWLAGRRAARERAA